MKKKLLVLLLGFIGLGTGVVAQQDMNLTHFMYNKSTFNPGATGIDLPNNAICAALMYRNQWDKVNGAPNSVVFNSEANLGSRNFPVNPGISVYHDQIGFTRQTNASLNISVPIQLPIGYLGIGLGLGIQNLGMAPDWIPPNTLIDPSLPTGYAVTQFDLNFGAYLRGNASSGTYYGGLSSTHLTAPSFESTGSMDPLTSKGSPYDAARHYYVTGGYKHNFDFGDIEGNVLFKTDMVKATADINARYIWDNWAYGGFTYRTSDAVAVMLGADIFKAIYGPTTGYDRLIIGYSYDYTTNKLSNISQGSHEILLKYCHYLPPVPITKSKHPRWL